MSWIPKWPSLGILIIIFLEWGITRSMMEEEEEYALLEIVGPSSHIALSGDLTIFIVRAKSPTIFTNVHAETQQTEASTVKDKEKFREATSEDHFLLRILYLLDDISELIGQVPVQSLPPGEENVTVVVPCGFFSRGGIYTVELQYKETLLPATYNNSPSRSKFEARTVLDVKWPMPLMHLESQHIATYPPRPVTATIKYEGISCEPSKDVPVALYILQLIYCGSNVVSCYPQNNTHAQVLYYEEVEGFSSPKVVELKCELFGLPGNYAIRLKASSKNPNAPNSSVYVKVDWSEEFSFNVHARSIYPCEGPGGVSVLFQYPACRLEGDRVRVYGRLRADVTSLASPSSLHYITELRSIPGKHTLTFDCEIFTEKFVEYCFVYVSQAINGAMADVKISCVPTFPFQESDAAGWGPWSAWSPCSSSCFGGIRNRYRFCDTPPPKYGARFCQGKAVETEFCGDSGMDNYKVWSLEDSECRNAGMLAASRPEVAAEIGLQCRCGCIITLQEEVSRKIVGANTQACPGRSFWLLQAQSKYVIGLHLDQLRFPCPGQYFRARDGDSLNANLLTDVAFDRTIRGTKTIISTGQNLLLEFFSDELTASGESCVGGFLAHATVLDKQYLRNGNFTVVPFEVSPKSAETNKSWVFWKPAHLATAVLLVLIFFVSIFLTLQFVVKYRKYRIAEDLDNLSDTSELVPGRSKSTSTLISDVPSIAEVTRKASKESLRDEERCLSTETLTGYKDGSSLSTSTLKLKDPLESSSEKTLTGRSTGSEKLLSASIVIAHSQPEVKYAYPVKLRTLDSGSPVEDRLMKGNDTLSNSSTRDFERTDCPKSKDSPGVLSTSSSLRSGKETKDRRNRERLLQGPGSEFSLSNPDSELELDYYDYNVANASAVPGSYLGMDPAFLVWIPPIDSTEVLDTEMQDLFLDPSKHKRNSILTLETEGTALTPSEYRRMKLSEEIRLDLDGESYLKPVMRIFEDSTCRINVESLPGGMERKHCVIPNRVSTPKDDEINSEKVLVETSEVEERRNTKDLKDSGKRKMVKSEEKSLSGHPKYKEFIESQSYESKKDAVDIPMIELAASPRRTFVPLKRMDNKEMEISKGPQSPDYGIEACRHQSFFDQDIKFVDEDDDDELMEGLNA